MEFDEATINCSDGNESQPGSTSARPKARRMCQVPGCTADLETTGKPYCSVKRICPEHMKADAIPCSSGLMRYCQQCGVLEPLALFDDITQLQGQPLQAREAPSSNRFTHQAQAPGQLQQLCIRRRQQHELLHSCWGRLCRSTRSSNQPCSDAGCSNACRLGRCLHGWCRCNAKRR